MNATDMRDATRRAVQDHCNHSALHVVRNASYEGRYEVALPKEIELTDRERGWFIANGYKVRVQEQQWVDIESGYQGQYDAITISWHP